MIETLITVFALGMVAGGWIVAITFYRLDKPVKEKSKKNYSRLMGMSLDLDNNELNISE